MIPTAFGAIRPSFFQNYWWLRSPKASDDRFAFCVDSDGDVYISYNSHNGNVFKSYGRTISPCTEFTNDAWPVFPSGDVYDYRYVNYDSYGRLQSLNSFMYYNYTSFYYIERRKYDYICSRILLRKKIADHGRHERQRLCFFSRPVWRPRRHQQCRRPFLREKTLRTRIGILMCVL